MAGDFLIAAACVGMIQIKQQGEIAANT